MGLGATKLKLKIDDVLTGSAGTYTVMGVIVFSEYDPEDRQHYLFEEWQLAGGSGQETWLQYDHYSKQLALYSGAHVGPIQNLASLHVGQPVSFVANGVNVNGQVREAGQATVHQQFGRLTYPVQYGEPILYAELQTNYGQWVIERFSTNRVEVYNKQGIPKSKQREVLGRKILPTVSKLSVALLAVLSLFMAGCISPFVFLVANAPEACTPRSAESPTGSSSEDCVRRPVSGSGTDTGRTGK